MIVFTIWDIIGLVFLGIFLVVVLSVAIFVWTHERRWKKFVERERRKRELSEEQESVNSGG